MLGKTGKKQEEWKWKKGREHARKKLYILASRGGSSEGTTKANHGPTNFYYTEPGLGCIKPGNVPLGRGHEKICRTRYKHISNYGLGRPYLQQVPEITTLHTCHIETPRISGDILPREQNLTWRNH